MSKSEFVTKYPRLAVLAMHAGTAWGWIEINISFYTCRVLCAICACAACLNGAIVEKSYVGLVLFAMLSVGFSIMLSVERQRLCQSLYPGLQGSFKPAGSGLAANYSAS